MIGPRLGAVLLAALLVVPVARGQDARPLRLEHGSPVSAVAFSPDDALVVTGGIYPQAGAALWDARTGKLLRRLTGLLDHQTLALAFSPDGKALAVGGRRIGSSSAGEVKLWEVATGKLLWRSSPLGSGVRAIAFSADGKLLATGPENARDRVRLWEAATGKPRRVLEQSAGEQQVLAFDVLGRTLTGAGEGVVRSWGIGSGKQLRRLPLREPPSPLDSRPFPAARLAVSADGRLLACLNDSGVLQLWEMVSGQRIREQALALPPDEPVARPVALSPDGVLLAAADERYGVGLWSVATGQPLDRLVGHQKTTVGFRIYTGDVRALAFSSDSRRLVTGGEDRIALVWDLPPALRAGRPHWTKRSDKELRAAWADLAKPEKQTAAAWVFTQTPEQAVPFLRERVKTKRKYISDWNVLLLLERMGSAEARQVLHELQSAPSPDADIPGVQSREALKRLAVRPLSIDPKGRAGPSPTEAQLEKHWTALAGDAAGAFRARCALAQAPQSAVELLGRRLGPIRPAEPARLKALLRDLSSEVYERRQDAHRALSELHELAEPALRAALSAKPTLETRRRVERLLGMLERPADVSPSQRLQALRAVAVLEQIGTPSARAVLRVVATGAPPALLTQEAHAALRRLERRGR